MKLHRLMLVGAAMLVAVLLAACAARASGNSAGPPTGQTTTPAAAAIASSTISPASEAPGATPGGPGGVQNLAITGAEKSELTALFAAALGIQVSEVPYEAPIQGDTYYAYDPATDTYWAMATFPLNAGDPAVVAAFREHGAVGLYRKAGAGAWQIDTSSAEGDYCAVLHYFPPAVLTAWALPTTPPPYQTC